MKGKTKTTYTFYVERSFEITVDGNANEETYDRAESKLLAENRWIDQDNIVDFDEDEFVDCDDW